MELPEEEFGRATSKGIGGTLGVAGVAGLATVTGGPDRAAEKVGWSGITEYDNCMHKFRGYVPVNILSAKQVGYSEGHK